MILGVMTVYSTCKQFTEVCFTEMQSWLIMSQSFDIPSQEVTGYPGLIWTQMLIHGRFLVFQTHTRMCAHTCIHKLIIWQAGQVLSNNTWHFKKNMTCKTQVSRFSWLIKMPNSFIDCIKWQNETWVICARHETKHKYDHGNYPWRYRLNSKGSCRYFAFIFHMDISYT